MGAPTVVGDLEVIGLVEEDAVADAEVEARVYRAKVVAHGDGTEARLEARAERDLESEARGWERSADRRPTMKEADQRAKKRRALSRWASARAAQRRMVSTAASRLRGPPWVSAMRGPKKARTSSACARSQKPVVTYGR